MTDGLLDLCVLRAVRASGGLRGVYGLWTRGLRELRGCKSRRSLPLLVAAAIADEARRSA